FPLTNNSPKARAENLTYPTPISTRPFQKPPRPAWTYTKWALAVSFALICMMGGAVFGNFYWRSPSFQKIVSTWLPSVPAAIINRDLSLAWTPERQFADKPHVINVLILGCDADYEEHNWRPVVIKDGKTRSDAILVAQVDFDRRTIHALTI